MAIGASVVSQSHTPNQANPLGWVEYFHGISLNLKRRCNGYLFLGTSTHQASEGRFPRRLSPVPLREETVITIESSFTCHGDIEVSPSWSLGNQFLCIHFFCAHCIHFFCFIHSFLLSTLYSFLLCTLHSFFGAHHIFFLSAHLFISSVHTTFIHFFSAHHIYSFLLCTWHQFLLCTPLGTPSIVRSFCYFICKICLLTRWLSGFPPITDCYGSFQQFSPYCYCPSTNSTESRKVTSTEWGSFPCTPGLF